MTGKRAEWNDLVRYDIVTARMTALVKALEWVTVVLDEDTMVLEVSGEVDGEYAVILTWHAVDRRQRKPVQGHDGEMYAYYRKRWSLVNFGVGLTPFYDDDGNVYYQPGEDEYEWCSRPATTAKAFLLDKQRERIKELARRKLEA